MFKKPGAKWDMERAMGVAGTAWGKEPTQCKKGIPKRGSLCMCGCQSPSRGRSVSMDTHAGCFIQS